MYIVLVGPKGSGKSHIGRLLQSRLGVHFFHVEPLWLAYHAECAAADRQPVIAEGIARINPALARAIDQHRHLCVETTGASREILDALLSLKSRSETIVARITAPIELCTKRIANRDATEQIPLDTEAIRNVHVLSESLELDADITLNNIRLTERQIVDPFENLLAEKEHHS